MGVYEYYLRQSLEIRWRRWLTNRYLNNWLAERVYYRMELTGRGTDNPDQRIQEDLGNFSAQTLDLVLDAMTNAVNLVSFILILWTLSGPISFALAGMNITIPAYMLWAAIVYAGFGTLVIHLIGRRLTALLFGQQRFEADFRFSLVRVRENAEGIALYGGEEDERLRLWDRFGSVFKNWFQIMRMRKRMLWFSTFYNQLAVIFPLVVAAPRYFSGGHFPRYADPDLPCLRPGSGFALLVHQLLYRHRQLEGQRRPVDQFRSGHGSRRSRRGRRGPESRSTRLTRRI